MSNRYRISFEEAIEPIDVRTEEEINEEHQRLALEIDEDSSEIDRQSELVEGLESLRMIAEKIGTPSPTEVALFRVAANMAVVGTEQRAQDFLPAMESHKPIALEGFGDKIKEVILKIYNFFKDLFIKIKNFIKGFFNIEEEIKKDIETEKEAVKNKTKLNTDNNVLRISFS